MQAVMTVGVTPERSYAQRQAALVKANRIRTYRRELKVRIKARERSISDVLLNPEPEVLSMKVVDVLLAAPKVGRVKANKWLSRAAASPSKTVGGLSSRQRLELVAVIGRK